MPLAVKLLSCYFRTLLLLMVAFPILRTHGQDSIRNHTDINGIIQDERIFDITTAAFVSKDFDVKTNFESINFEKPKGTRIIITPEKVSKKAVVKFDVVNSSDTAKGIYFLPGFYYETINLYRKGANGLEPIPAAMPNHSDSIGYRRFSLEPNDSTTIIAELSFLKTYNNSIRPRLINESFINSFITNAYHLNPMMEIVNYIFCGLMLMMFLYSLATWIQGGNKEFLYYFLFAGFLGIMLFTKSFFDQQTTQTAYFLESYLDFIFQCAGHMFYMLFLQRFLETKKKFPFLYHLYNFGIVVTTLAILSYSYFHFFTDDFRIQNSIETWAKNLLILMVPAFIIYGIRYWNDRLMRYMIWGNLFLFIFSLASIALIEFNPRLTGLHPIFRNSLFYYELGLLIELIFFLIGLSYKNKRQIIEQTRERERLKAENQMKEIEKELAVYKAQQEERNRISADMHDELGSGMTAIRLMSEIAKNKMKETTPSEIDKISSSADDLLNKMNAIIWSMNSGNDTVDNLISYIRAYSLEYFEGTPVKCKIHTPVSIPDRELTGDKRRNIFLCVKESLNNVLKHSKASEVMIDIKVSDDLTINISDNGIGIDMDHLRQFGNGLQNITRRMKNIGGSFKIENTQGASTTLVLPLNTI